MARRRPRPGDSTPGAVAAPRTRDACEKARLPLDRRQAVRPLGQGRHSEPHRSLRAARFSRSDRRRISRGHRRSRGSTSAASHSIDVVWVPDVYAEPHAADRAPLGAAAAADARRDRLRRSRSACFRIARSTARGGMCSAPGFEFSLSYFDGFNHLPQFTALPLSGQPLVALQRTYAPLRMAGADAAVPLRWFTVKGEIASLFTTSDDADDVVVYVVQLERQSGELSLVAGYAGEIVTERRSTFDFAPDRGPDARVSRARGLHHRRDERRLASKPPCARISTASGSKAQYSEAHRRALARDVRRRRHRRRRRATSSASTAATRTFSQR